MVAGDGRSWTHELLPDEDGSFRVEVIDEEGVRFPIGRKLTESQARLLVRRVAAEVEASGRPSSAVIRDAPFMSATILTVKRNP